MTSNRANNANRTKADRRCVALQRGGGLNGKCGLSIELGTIRCSRGNTIAAKEVVPCLPSPLSPLGSRDGRSNDVSSIGSACPSIVRLGALVTTSTVSSDAWIMAIASAGSVELCMSRLSPRREPATGAVALEYLPWTTSGPAEGPVRAALRRSLTGAGLSIAKSGTASGSSPDIVDGPAGLRFSVESPPPGWGCRGWGFHWLLS